MLKNMRFDRRPVVKATVYGYPGDAGREPIGMDIRHATQADVPDMQAIYAHHVLHGTGTFEEEPPSVEEMADRFHKVVDHGSVWLVATDATGVLGYGYYAPFRDRSAYRFTVEDSIYVREDVRGQGVGKALVSRLIELATSAGLRQMIAVIGDSENVGSIGVHASLGFHMVGTMRATGIKFGRWIDVVTMQRSLGKGDMNLPV
jgi:L-amino acid N-acyltransferase YncA